MKFDNDKTQKTQDVEIVKQVEAKKTLVLQKSELKIPNHIVWEYNRTTKYLDRAQYTITDNILDFTVPDPAKHFLSKHRIGTKENCLYFQALNFKNACKRLNRDFNIHEIRSNSK